MASLYIPSVDVSEMGGGGGSDSNNTSSLIIANNVDCMQYKIYIFFLLIMFSHIFVAKTFSLYLTSQRLLSNLGNVTKYM